MSTVTLQVGHIANGNEVIVRQLSTMPPFAKPNCIIMEEYVENVDFTAGDTLVFEFKSVTKIFAIATDDVGATIDYVEAALSGAYTGRKLTFTAPASGNFKLFAITDL